MTAERIPPLLTLAADYEILRELGRGGTAVVYLARERATDTEVAIKLIHAKYAEDDEAVARFAREARFVAQLDHPNVVRVHAVLDLGEGGIALVMAHVAGRTLKQLIFEDGPLPPERAERMMRDVAHALAEAHARGIVHRDVKPENIFIDGDGRALLADFGVARSMSSETQQLTMHGVAIGTPTYMAPEQIDGGELDGRGDIYSLGLVAWEMLTGRRPWDGEALYSVLYHQKHVQLPAVRELRPDIPARLADAIAGAIEKERDARWQNVDELIAALDGNAPPRRAPAVIPASSETVRFTRPPDSQPVAAASPAASAFAPATSVVVKTGERAHPSRRVVVAGALVSLVAIILVASAVQAWSDGVARRRQQSQAAFVPVTRAVSAGAVVPQGAVNVNGASVADSSAAAGIDSPIGVAIGVTQPSEPLTPGGQSSPAGIGGTPTVSLAPSSVTVRAVPPPSPDPPITVAPAPAPATIATSAIPAARSRMRIVAGGRHTCLVTADGRGFCWGGNDRGQLGTGGTNRMATPALIATDQRFIAVAPGLSHSCALDADGAAWCWGENDRGQLGDRTTSSRATPLRVADGHSFRSIAAGASHSCGLGTNGIASCWGANGFGQLGDGEARDRGAPVAVATSKRFVSIDAGWHFTCALDAEGRAMCWGDNGAGQLGDGGTTSRRAPVAVQGRLSFASISAGNAHACGATAGGETYCWGANASGQLGDGSTADHSTPVHVAGDARFVTVATGAVHSCALTAEGEAFCWGRNTYGQLGDGGTEDHSLPARVAGGHAFTTIRAFGSHTCGATVSGEAFCWGYNLDGQLGDGTRTHRTRPVYVERPGGR